MLLATTALSLFLSQLFFVADLKPAPVHNDFEQSKLLPAKMRTRNGFDTLELPISDPLERSINEDMGKISRKLLHEQVYTDKSRQPTFRSLRNIKLVKSLSASYLERTNDIAQFEIVNAQPAFIPNLNKQNFSFFNFDPSVESVSNNLSLPLLNNASHQSNHQKPLHSTIPDEIQFKPRDQSTCGSRTNLRIFLQLFQAWNYSSCEFTQSDFRESRIFLTDGSASKVVCCWLQKFLRANQSKTRRRTKRDLQKGRTYTFDEIKKQLMQELNITPKEKMHREKLRTDPRHDPYRGKSKGDLVTLPANSVSNENRYSRKRILPGIYMKLGGRILCVSRNGRIRGIQYSSQISQSCVLRRIPATSHDGKAVYKLLAEKTGYYLAMNGTYYLYTTKNSYDANTEFLHHFNKNSHDAFESKPHQSLIAFNWNGKPLNIRINSTSSEKFHHLLEINLRTLKNMSGSHQPRRRKNRLKSVNTAAITTQQASTSSVTMTSPTTDRAVSTVTSTSAVRAPTKKNRTRQKHKRKRNRKKKGKKRKRKKNKEGRKSSKRCSERNCRKRNRKKKKGKKRQRRSSSPLANKQSNLKFQNNFLLNRILSLKVFSKSQTPT